MTKLVLGVGVNDLGYRVQINEDVTKDGGERIRETVFRCKYYTAWVSMLTRCHSKKYLERNQSYIGTGVCSEWLSATAFKKWMEQQDWHGKCLDKDIIVPGSRLYSPETCAFVLQATNKFVNANDASRGNYPIGVSLFKRTGEYIARCKNPFTGKNEHLGLFSTSEEAHEAWRKRKHELAQLVAATESDPRVVEALKKRYSFEEWYKSITPAFRTWKDNNYSGKLGENQMNTINERNAPPGCIAVTPEQFADGAGSCAGCCFDSGDDNGCLLDMASSVMYTPCWAEGREDNTDVIFKEQN